MKNNKNEYIICSAILFAESKNVDYKDLLTVNEMSEAVKTLFGIPFNEHIICGRRHSDCYLIVKRLNESLYRKMTDENTIKGFMTSKGRFVNRSEAYKIAKEEEQFYMPELSNNELTKLLTSEDLYGVDY